MKKNSTRRIVSSWDWDVGCKVTDISSWQELGIEEFQVSPDGENLAAVVKTGEDTFKVYDTRKTWDNHQFNKIWNLRFTKNGVSYACVKIQDEWTVAIEGNMWKKSYDYIWNLLHSSSNKKFSIAAAVKKDMQYCMVLNGKIWPRLFTALTYCTLSQDGLRTAAVVQIKPHRSGEVHKFKEGIYTVSVDGVPWETNFLNVWGVSISKDSISVAAEVRLNLYEYSIAVDDVIWSEKYTCVWKPIFHPKDNSVIAPVRVGSRWGMAANGYTIWDAKFYQLWHQQYDPKGVNLAAIISPQYGRWTVAVNEIPWEISVDSMITDLTFSNNANRLAVLAKHKNFWYIMVDNSIWNHKLDMAWPPVFSHDGKNIAAKVRVNGRYTFALNGKLYKDYFDEAWNPKFNLKGNKLLIRVVKGNNYERRVIMLDGY